MSLLLLNRAEDESTYGYIQRVLLENGLTWGWLGSQVKLTQGVLPNWNYLTALKPWFAESITENDLLRPLIRRNEGKVYRLYGDEFLDRSQVPLTFPKICPDCVLSFGYCRKVWDLGQITACPHHRKRLVRACLNCRTTLSWLRDDVMVCRCGYIYDAEPTPVCDEEIIWASWLSKRLSGVAVHVGHALDHMSHLRLGFVMRLIRALGMGNLPNILACKPLRTKLDIPTYADVVCEAIKILGRVFSDEVEAPLVLTHWQELAFQRLHEASTSIEEMTVLKLFVERLTERAFLPSAGAYQLNLDFNHHD